MWKLHNLDILEWAENYKEIQFHAILCDPPYNLESITKRFGKTNATPAKYGKDGAFSRASKGFMGKEWDTDIAFRSDTWFRLKDHLYPGAFGLAFSSPRTYHLLATALEDAGFIIHPCIGWIQSQGFPKATRIDTQIDKRAGAERKIVGKLEHPGSTKDRISMHDGWQDAPDLTEPTTELAKIWEGYRYGLQALKPCMEPICMFQKPFDGKPVDNITGSGAGALWIEGTKFKTNREFIINRFNDGMKPFGEGAGHAYTSETMDKLYPANVVLSGEDGFLENYFYCAKASKKEKDLGLEEHNLHPTIKPIKLIEYLATLLLPPQAYSPRKLLVPFAGTGSEMIGALKSGWDYVEGVELEKDSAEVGAKRLAYWVKDENN